MSDQEPIPAEIRRIFDPIARRPHVSVFLRGVKQDGRDLVARDVRSSGFRGSHEVCAFADRLLSVLPDVVERTPLVEEIMPEDVREEGHDGILLVRLVDPDASGLDAFEIWASRVFCEPRRARASIREWEIEALLGPMIADGVEAKLRELAEASSKKVQVASGPLVDRLSRLRKKG